MLLVANTFFAQQGISYKAIITDNDAVLANASIDVQFTILENGTTNVYQETHTTTTDTNGIIILNIGEGLVVSGNFNNIDWNEQQFLKVEIDTGSGSGYEDFGTTEFKFVPYAKHAETASFVENTFWHQTSNAINSVDPVGIGEDTENEANLHINDVTGGLPLIKMTSDDNIYTIWQSNRSGVDDYLIGIDGGNNKFLFANSTTSQFPLTLQGDKVGINNLYPTANLDVLGTMKYVDGNQGTGKVLTSDASGNATWQATTGVTALNDLSDATTTLNDSFFIGGNAGNTTSTGSSNNGLGFSALHSLTTGSYNNAFGYLSLGANTTGAENSGFGQWTLFSNEDGNSNTAMGYAALYNKTSGSNNTALGANAGYDNVTGTGNVFLGNDAGYHETGDNKLYIENTSSTTPLIGGDFDTDEVTINGSIAIVDGTQGVDKVLTSDANGKASWETPVTGVTALNDLSDAKTDGASIFIGNGAGVNDDGSNNENTAIGFSALNAITSGSLNTAIGNYSLHANTTGEANTAIGDYSLRNNTGQGNTATGTYSLLNSTTGNFNTVTGSFSLYTNSTGHDNTANGSYALYSNTGSYNTAIGDSSGYNATGSSNIFLGYQAGFHETGDNKLYIENSDSDTPLIGGDFDTNEVTINGDIEITGKVKAADSGDTDMKAYIYGSITSNGSNSTYGAQSNGFTVFKPSVGAYTVSFTATNAPTTNGQYTVMVNMRYGDIGFITVTNHSDSFTINTYDTSGVLANKAFNFVVFKK